MYKVLCESWGFYWLFSRLCKSSLRLSCYLVPLEFIVSIKLRVLRSGKMASSLLVQLCCYLLLFASLSALKPAFQVVVPSLNALTVSGVPSSYVKRLFERSGPITVARRRRAPRKSFLYLSYCYWVVMWRSTLAPIGSTLVPRVTNQLKPTKMAYFARYVWYYGTIDIVWEWVLMITSIGAKLKKDGFVLNGQEKPSLSGISLV